VFHFGGKLPEHRQDLDDAHCHGGPHRVHDHPYGPWKDEQQQRATSSNTVRTTVMRFAELVISHSSEVPGSTPIALGRRGRDVDRMLMIQGAAL
jgi:hypothetical protein